MKLGITVSTFKTQFGPIIFRGGNIKEDLKNIRQLGYEGVDLFIDRKSNSELEELGKLFKEENIEIPMMLAIFLAEIGVNLSNKDKARRIEGIEEYKKQILCAEKIGAKRMAVGFLRGMKDEGVSLQQHYELLADSLRDLSDFSANHGVTICLEPINRYEVNNINTVGQCVDFINEYDLPKIKILADTFHMNIEDASVQDSIIKAGSMIEHIHIADSNRLVPGKGHFDFDSFLGALKEINYKNYLNVEAFSGDDILKNSEDAIKFMKSKIY